MRRIGLITAMACGLVLGVPQQASTPTLSEVDQLLLALSDITWFNNIRPLNLTKPQIERLIPAHERAYKQLERLVQEEAKELRNRKDEILRIREDTARGKSLPKEFLETIKRLETDAAQKRRQLRAQVVSEVATELKPTFTDEQFQYMVKRSKEVLEAARVDVAQLKDDQLYALFVESVFLDPRAPELLKEWQRKNLQ
jgi:phosphoenolpyruvate-protein kinase (PTS system EI component)